MSTFTYIAPVFRVEDLTRSLAFYRGGLGFEVEFCYEGFYASVCRDGCRIHLKCAPAAARDTTQTDDLDACVVVESAAAPSESPASAGVAFAVPLRSAPYGTEFYVRDPDGCLLGFVEPASA